MKWLIKNGTIASEEKTFLADLLLEDDKIIKIDTNIEDVLMQKDVMLCRVQ